MQKKATVIGRRILLIDSHFERQRLWQFVHGALRETGMRSHRLARMKRMQLSAHRCRDSVRANWVEPNVAEPERSGGIGCWKGVAA
jgi:hypothetical protein